MLPEVKIRKSALKYSTSVPQPAHPRPLVLRVQERKQGAASARSCNRALCTAVSSVGCL